MSEPLDELVREAREHLGAREAASVDWRAVDSALLARVAQAGQPGHFRTGQGRWKPRALAGVLALSVAALALVELRGRRESVQAPEGARADGENRDEVVSIEGDGQALVRGVASAGGTRLQVGVVVETKLVSVTLQRAGKVTMRLEPDSRVRVTKMRETLVLELERGAIEARVTPVAHGEAFAVDVEGSRVAVHGTHLRVQRADRKVIVDVDEGVIAVGDAPRVGPVLGAVVVAPAHAEFMAFDALGSLRVSREPATLRWAAPKAGSGQGGSVATPESHAEPAPSHGVAMPSGEPRGEARVAPAAGSGPAPSAAPEADLVGIVRRCMAERPRAENVSILMRTTLRLTLGDDGWVQSARFEPPVAPDVNACAAQSIYRTHFDHGGEATIAVDFKN